MGGPKRRRLLAALLLHAGEVVSVDRLVEAVWEDEPSARAETTLRARVAKVRRVLATAGAEELLVTRRPGYSLQVAPEHVDASRFEGISKQGSTQLWQPIPTVIW